MAGRWKYVGIGAGAAAAGLGVGIALTYRPTGSHSGNAGYTQPETAVNEITGSQNESSVITGNQTAPLISNPDLVKEAADKYNSGETGRIFMQYLTNHSDQNHLFYRIDMDLVENKDCSIGGHYADLANVNNLYNLPDVPTSVKEYLLPGINTLPEKAWLADSFGKSEIGPGGSLTIIETDVGPPYPTYSSVSVYEKYWNDDPLKSAEIANNNHENNEYCQSLADFNKQLPDYAKFGVLKGHEDLISQAGNHTLSVNDSFVAHFIYGITQMSDPHAALYAGIGFGIVTAGMRLTEAGVAFSKNSKMHRAFEIMHKPIYESFGRFNEFGNAVADGLVVIDNAITDNASRIKSRISSGFENLKNFLFDF